MESHRPKWAQPLKGPRVCSICSSPEVFFERTEEWPDLVDFGSKAVYPFVMFTVTSMKCWCKDCYEDCGGQSLK